MWVENKLKVQKDRGGVEKNLVGVEERRYRYIDICTAEGQVTVTEQIPDL